MTNKIELTQGSVAEAVYAAALASFRDERAETYLMINGEPAAKIVALDDTEVKLGRAL